MPTNLIDNPFPKNEKPFILVLNRISASEFKSGHVPPDLLTLIGQEPRLDQKKLKNYKKWRKAYGNGVQCLVPSCFDVFYLDRSIGCIFGT